MKRVLVATAAVGAMALSACGGEETAQETVTVTESEVGGEDSGEDGDDASPSESTDDQSSESSSDATTEEPAGEPSESTDDQSPESSSDADSESPSDDSGGQAGKDSVAEPGTTVAMGEPGILHVQALEEGEEYYGYGILEVTVEDVEEFDEEDWEQFENGEQMAGFVPWVVTVKQTRMSAEGNPNGNMMATFRGLTSNDREVVGVGGTGTWGDCELEVPEFTSGATGTQCVVMPLPEGEDLTAITWHGDDYADGGTSSPYEDDPVVFELD